MQLRCMICKGTTDISALGKVVKLDSWTCTTCCDKINNLINNDKPGLIKELKALTNRENLVIEESNVSGAKFFKEGWNAGFDFAKKEIQNIIDKYEE